MKNTLLLLGILMMGASAAQADGNLDPLPNAGDGWVDPATAGQTTDRRRS